MRKLEIHTIQMIDSFDWDELVKEVYGRPYCFQQQDGCKSRGTVDLEVVGAERWKIDEWEDEYADTKTILEEVNGSEMGVSFESWLARDPKEWNGAAEDKDSWSITLFWNRNFYPHTDVLANDLCKRGLIKEGDYTINIDW